MITLWLMESFLVHHVYSGMRLEFFNYASRFNVTRATDIKLCANNSRSEMVSIIPSTVNCTLTAPCCCSYSLDTKIGIPLFIQDLQTLIENSFCQVWVVYSPSFGRLFFLCHESHANTKKREQIRNGPIHVKVVDVDKYA